MHNYLMHYPFISLAILLIVGLFASFLCKKIGLPAITGQIFLGILLGPTFLNIIEYNTGQSLEPVINFAIALIAFTVGTHLNFSRLHNSYKRILTISLLEGSFAFLVVFLSFFYINPLNMEEIFLLPSSMLIASLACATSPASALHVIKEKHAKGIIVKTLIGVIAIDNILCLLIFELSRAISKSIILDKDLISNLAQGALGIFISVTLGIVIALVLHINTKSLAKKYKQKDNTFFNSTLMSFIFISIILLDGLCSLTNDLTQKSGIFVSPIMAHLTFGLIITNLSRLKDDFLKQFSYFETIVFTCFFTLAGAHLDLNKAEWIIFLPFFTYLIALIVGKYCGAKIGSYISNSPQKIKKYIGSTLFVQGGITIGLLWVINSEKNFQIFSQELTTFILSCVIFTELIGTIFISKTLEKTKEVNQNKSRLIDFIEEEFIIPSLFAHNRWETIDALCHFMIKTHKIELSEEKLRKNLTRREKESSTGIGMGIAIPHIKIKMPETDSIKGVFAMVDPPIDFGADDGPANFIVLIITPLGNEERHLSVIANITKLLKEKSIRKQLLAAKTAAEIYDIIHSQEAEEYNYFL